MIFLLALGFATFAFGKKYRIYSILTFLVLLVFGALTFLEAPAVGVNQPTPWIGVWERINIGVSLLWITALANTLIVALSDLDENHLRTRWKSFSVRSDSPSFVAC
jgi:hypothetical protein